VKKPALVRSSEVAGAFERRAARAERLASETSSPTEPLWFAAALFRAQGELAGALESVHARTPLSGRLERDVAAVRESSPVVLSAAARSASPVLSEAARERSADLPSTAETRLLVYWSGDRPTSEDYLSRAILRPYVEVLRSLSRSPDRVHRRGSCPFCGGLPAIVSRRDGSELEGARRLLGCGLCGGDWTFQRILCPSCYEEDPAKLPSFRSEHHPAVRIEACETCRRYVKSLDLSEDARPIPEVDDLVSLSMDLWAVEQGFTRIEPGLAGL
jgi:formate dehydrogenase maturation protein FdhE